MARYREALMADYTPYDPRPISELLKIHEKTFQELEEDKKTLLEKSEVIRQEHVKQLEKIVKPLKRDASFAEIDKACAAIVAGHKKIKSKLNPQIIKFENESDLYLNKNDRLQHTYYLMEEGMTPKEKKFSKEKRKMLGELKDEMIDIIDGTYGKVRDRTLHQLQVRKTCKNLDLDEQLIVENSIFSHFLNDKRTEKPEVEIAPKTDLTLKNTSIPPEIMSMVYSHSSLESAVALRQVSSCWYNSFSQNEKILRRKLRLRSPWMKREGDLTTWALCALVFVSRLASKRWLSHKNLSRLTAGSRPSPHVTVVAYELEYREKLSMTFTPLETHDFPCFSKWCGKVHFGNVSLNLKTHEFVQNRGGYGAKLLKMDEKETVILFEDFKLILPPGIYFHTVGTQNFDLLPSFIVVRTVGQTYVLPRNTPDYKKGFSYTHDYGSFEVGGVYVKHAAPYQNQQKNTFDFYNPYTRRFIPYDGPVGAMPVSHYNGLMWWWVKDCKLIGTFVDQSEPDKVYNSRSKTTTLRAWGEKPEPIGGGRYLARVEKGGMLLIDMIRGLVAEVLFPEGQGKMLLGKERGIFIPRCISEETLGKWLEKGQKELEKISKQV